MAKLVQENEYPLFLLENLGLSVIFSNEHYSQSFSSYFRRQILLQSKEQKRRGRKSETNLIIFIV